VAEATSIGKLGIIGGSGLYDLPALEVIEHTSVETPFGSPSDEFVLGRLHGREIVFLPRHGRGHRLLPSELPFQANVYGFKALGVTHLLSVSAVGSLREELPPLTLVVPDQIIDRTVSRPRTFFGHGLVAHVGIAEPFCPVFRRAVLAAAASTERGVVDGGTYLCIEGPQFSTKAESKLYRTWGASIIGMTAMPEARLAREAELCYATLALVTDYDVWHDDFDQVTVQLVIANLLANVAAAQQVIDTLSLAALPERTCACAEALKTALITAPEVIPADIRDRLGVIAAEYMTSNA
jgi:5'-methylthioadenosine phosphorylase